MPKLTVASVAAFVVAYLVASASPAPAQDGRGGTPGQFDFYVLSLSWSPSFCAAAAERNSGRSSGGECGVRPYSFVVHGLWPQYEKGFPEDCQMPAPRISYRLVSSILDLMPAPRLVFNEWDKHGTCSGLPPAAYFDAIRKARAAVTIPPEYLDVKQPLQITPDAVAQAFVKANPGLTRNGLAVECSKTRLSEIRICLSKELQFRECPDIARHACRSDHLLMPPVRGG